MAYRIGPNWNATVPEIENALASNRFVECTPGQDKSVGWTEPRGIEHGPLIESVGGQLIAKLMIETKAVPSSVVKRKAALQAQEIESKTGRKPGKKETREMREDILHSLLPQAFAKQGAVMVWINPKDRLLAIDASSTGKADEVITQLVRALPGLDLNLLQTATSPQTGMTAWLPAAGIAPSPADSAAMAMSAATLLRSGFMRPPWCWRRRRRSARRPGRGHRRRRQARLRPGPRTLCGRRRGRASRCRCGLRPPRGARRPSSRHSHAGPAHPGPAGRRGPRVGAGA